MKYYQLSICLFLPFFLTAQINFTTTTLTGFELNINKSPKILVIEGEVIDKEELYLNSMYQDLNLQFKIFKKIKNNTIAFNFSTEIRYYFTEPEVNQLIFNSRIGHKFTIKKNFKWENNIQYKNKNRKGQDLDANELSLPFGYKIFKFNTGLRFRMSKNNRSLFRLNYANKKFDNSETRNVQYQLYGFENELKQIKWKNHLLHSYGILLGYNQRNYTISNFEEETTTNRIWSYIDVSSFYKLPLSKNWSIKTELNFQKRIDNSNDVFGYLEIRPELNINYENSRFLAKLMTSYAVRKLKNITARNPEEVTLGSLQYNYFRIIGKATYNITSNFAAVAEGYLINRASNNTNINTNAFRGYSNNYIGIGIQYKI